MSLEAWDHPDGGEKKHTGPVLFSPTKIATSEVLSDGTRIGNEKAVALLGTANRRLA